MCCMDMLIHIMNLMLYNDANINKELKSDVTLALALTHHLILTQQYPLPQILKKINNLSNKYVFIEFMPLGLWGGGKKSKIPKGYTVDWFRKNFEKYFKIIGEKNFEENRYLFIGEKINNH